MAVGAQEAMEECASDVTAGTSQQQQTRLLGAAEDLLCPICLNDIENTAYMAFCFHHFCLECIQQWAKTDSHIQHVSGANPAEYRAAPGWPYSCTSC
uniref:RING-type E3 ubiquitin transferase n=1 Tax=Cairina moschata TaxID=8855 RepID=A0A8C3CUK0_CAIMO